MLDIPEVQFKLSLPGQAIATVDLSPAGNTGSHFVPLGLFVGVAGQVFRRERPGAHEAHITTQDIPEFGQFIQTTGAQEVTPGVRAIGIATRAKLHTAKLYNLKGPTLAAGAHLSEKEGTSQLEPLHAGKPQQKRRKHDQAKKTEENIKGAFHEVKFSVIIEEGFGFGYL